MRKLLCAAAMAFALIGASPTPEVKLWRMDCGKFTFGDLNFFSDSWAYTGQSRTLTNSCYLIQHGKDYMLWDTGLGAELVGRPGEMMPGVGIEVKESLASQLAKLGIKPEQVSVVGISHNHGDHIGQAATFPTAKLLIGAKDWDQITAKDHSPQLDPGRLKPWVDGGAPKELVKGDKDVFGDGSVMMISTPGHTPDHHSLLVRLKNSGPVLLTGDLYHFTEQRERGGIPPFNFNRADTLASFDRFNAIAKNLKATVIIQHEPADVAKLPIFPKAAD